MTVKRVRSGQIRRALIDAFFAGGLPHEVRYSELVTAVVTRIPELGPATNSGRANTAVHRELVRMLSEGTVERPARGTWRLRLGWDLVARPIEILRQASEQYRLGQVCGVPRESYPFGGWLDGSFVQLLWWKATAPPAFPNLAKSGEKPGYEFTKEENNVCRQVLNGVDGLVRKSPYIVPLILQLVLDRVMKSYPVVVFACPYRHGDPLPGGTDTLILGFPPPPTPTDEKARTTSTTRRRKR